MCLDFGFLIYTVITFHKVPAPLHITFSFSVDLGGWGGNQRTISKVRVNIELLIIVTSRVLDKLNKKDSTK